MVLTSISKLLARACAVRPLFRRDRLTTQTRPIRTTNDYLIRPDPADPRLTDRNSGVDQAARRYHLGNGRARADDYLNRQEIVTAMTIGDYPDYVAIGYLLNRDMLQVDDVVAGVDYDGTSPSPSCAPSARPTTRTSCRNAHRPRAARKARHSAT